MSDEIIQWLRCDPMGEIYIEDDMVYIVIRNPDNHNEWFETFTNINSIVNGPNWDYYAED